MDFEEQQKLLQAPTNGNVYTQYNRGPRKATDRWIGVVFIASILTYIIWSAINLTGKMYLWNFVADDWEVDGQGNCVDKGAFNITVDTSCAATITELVMVPVGFSVVGSTIFGILLVIGFKYAPNVLAWISVVAQVIIPAIGGALLLAYGNKLSTDCINDDDFVDDDDCQSTSTMGYTFPAAMLFIIAFIMAIIYYLIRPAVKFVAETLRFATVALGETPSLIFVKFGFYLIFMVFGLGMWSLVVMYFLSGSVQPSIDTYNPDFPTSCAFVQNFEHQSTGSVYAYVLVSCVVCGWFFFWGLETRDYIVADTMAHWYYHGKENGGNISRAIKHAFCSHFGSLAGAGFAMWLIEEMKKRSNSGILGILVRCILSYIEFLFKTGVIMMGITGMSFGNSGIEVGRLFWSSFGNVTSSTVMWSLPKRMMMMLAFLMSALWGVIYGFSAYAVTLKQCRMGHLTCLGGVGSSTTPSPDSGDDSMTCEQVATIYGAASGAGVFFICFLTVAFIVSILLTIADTAFICFLLDKRDGVVTQPTIHKAFNDMIRWRNSSTCCNRAPRVKPKCPSYLGNIPPGYAACEVPPPYADVRYFNNGNVGQQQQPPPQAQPQPQPPVYPQSQPPAYVTSTVTTTTYYN